MLRAKNWITLREGRCQKYKNSEGEEDFCQKGVDALVIIDMLEAKENFPHIKKIVLIASDSDFVPLIEKMKQKGYEVIIYTYFDRIRKSRFSTSNQLLKVASRWERLVKEYFEEAKK